MTELGNRLKQTREAKGLSLEDLQTITKIQKRYLIGIEEGNYGIMPGQFYTRAFIKQYSEAVGLDPEEIFEEYKNDIPVNDKEEIPQLSRVKTRKQISGKDSKVLNFLPKILLFLGLIAIIAIFYIVIQQYYNDNAGQQTNQEQDEGLILDSANPISDSDTDGSDNDTAEDATEETEEEPVEEEQAVGTLTEVQKSGDSATYELSNTDKFEVELTSSGETWVGIVNPDNERFFYGLIVEGQTETVDLSQEEEIIFNIGRSYETDIKINGETFEFPFPTDQVIQQRITIKFSPNGEQ